MKGSVIAGLVMLMLFMGAAAQQQQPPAPQPTPVPAAGQIPFQTVTVDGVLYTVDPFYVSACFIKSRTEDIAEPTSIVAQCFLREGTAMVALPVIHTDNSGIAELVHVGEVMYGYPQAAMEGAAPP